ncbi:chromosome partitioning protein ParB [Oleispira antarctica]|uniref:Probable chromosome-partitioning protein ParB n=1 Tax=Oleispira antarctica TaxID=188908 RepID=A0A1Y5I0I7_OLEAN|nr:chromosome partitioning protein ParB [Oleispira antarctica]
MSKKRGLGRGLDALLGDALAHSKPAAEAANSNEQQEVSIQPNEAESVANQAGGIKHLPVEFIQPGQYQPRKDMHQEALEELAASIKAQGLMQPIVIRPLVGKDDRYEIIAGERRWRATQLAGLDTVPVIIRDVPDDAAIAMALIENIQRENLNSMEEAQALHRLQQEFELTQQEVGDAVGKSRATVANLLRLMQLNDDVKIMLERGDIEMGHAKALLGLQDQKQSEAARHVVAKEMTVRQTEAYVRNLQEEVKPKEKSRPNPDIQRLERTLGERLGANVAIQHSAKGKGKLVINYSNLDELDGILAHIQ